MAPTRALTLKEQDNAKAVLARSVALLREANARLQQSRLWYQEVRETYADPSQAGDRP